LSPEPTIASAMETEEPLLAIADAPQSEVPTASAMDTEEPLLAIADVSAPVVTAMDTGDPSLLALQDRANTTLFNAATQYAAQNPLARVDTQRAAFRSLPPTRPRQPTNLTDSRVTPDPTRPVAMITDGEPNITPSMRVALSNLIRPQPPQRRLTDGFAGGVRAIVPFEPQYTRPDDAPEQHKT
jgi:hypothetical protein